MLGCEQLMLMPVPSVVSADGSCCTWALPTATTEKEGGKGKDHQRLPSSDGSFPRETVRNSGSETEPDWNGWRHVPTGMESDPGVDVWSEGRSLGRNLKSMRADIE